MAVIVKTDDPQKLLNLIKQQIDLKKIETWSYDNSTGYFTHNPEQWKFKAWFWTRVYAQELRFGILAPKDVNLSVSVYGVYHGRFIEMLLSHFDKNFTEAYATAQKTDPDYFVIKPK